MLPCAVVLLIFEPAGATDGARQPDLLVRRLLIQHVILFTPEFKVQHSI